MSSAGYLYNPSLLNTVAVPVREDSKPRAAAAGSNRWPQVEAVTSCLGHPSTSAAGTQTGRTHKGAELSVVPLQKDLKKDLKEEKKENHIMQSQVLEAHKQVLEEGRHLKTSQAALRQRDAEVARLQAKLREWVSSAALAPVFVKLTGSLRRRQTPEAAGGRYWSPDGA